MLKSITKIFSLCFIAFSLATEATVGIRYIDGTGRTVSKNISPKPNAYSFPDDYDFGGIDYRQVTYIALNDDVQYCISEYNFPNLQAVRFSSSSTNLSQCVFPPSLTSVIGFSSLRLHEIPANLFNGCINLQSSITSHVNVVAIGESAFRNCQKMHIGFYGNSQLQKIGENAFRGCTSLKTVLLPRQLQTICDNAFAECYALDTVNISSNVCFIGQSAFRSCPLRTSINLGKPHQLYIGPYAFAGCSFSSIEIPSCVRFIGNHAFSGNLSLQSLNIDGEYIGNYATDGCKNLSQLAIGNHVKYIGEGAFSNKSKLQVTWPDFSQSSLKIIADSAFANDICINSVAFPEKLMSIGKNAFQNVYLLASVSFPSNLVYVDKNAFDGCINIKSLQMHSSSAVNDFSQDLDYQPINDDTNDKEKQIVEFIEFIITAFSKVQNYVALESKFTENQYDYYAFIARKDVSEVVSLCNDAINRLNAAHGECLFRFQHFASGSINILADVFDSDESMIDLCQKIDNHGYDVIKFELLYGYYGDFKEQCDRCLRYVKDYHFTEYGLVVCNDCWPYFDWYVREGHTIKLAVLDFYPNEWSYDYYPSSQHYDEIFNNIQHNISPIFDDEYGYIIGDDHPTLYADVNYRLIEGWFALLADMPYEIYHYRSHFDGDFASYGGIDWTICDFDTSDSLRISKDSQIMQYYGPDNFMYGFMINSFTNVIINAVWCPDQLYDEYYEYLRKATIPEFKSFDVSQFNNLTSLVIRLNSDLDFDNIMHPNVVKDNNIKVDLVDGNGYYATIYGDFGAYSSLTVNAGCNIRSIQNTSSHDFLRELYIYSTNVNYMQNGIFSGMRMLNNAYVDSSYIPSGCFEGCISLTNVTIGSNVKQIHDNAFAYCNFSHSTMRNMINALTNNASKLEYIGANIFASSYYDAAADVLRDPYLCTESEYRILRTQSNAYDVNQYVNICETNRFQLRKSLSQEFTYIKKNDQVDIELINDGKYITNIVSKLDQPYIVFGNGSVQYPTPTCQLFTKNQLINSYGKMTYIADASKSKYSECEYTLGKNEQVLTALYTYNEATEPWQPYDAVISKEAIKHIASPDGLPIVNGKIVSSRTYPAYELSEHETYYKSRQTPHIEWHENEDTFISYILGLGERYDSTNKCVKDKNNQIVYELNEYETYNNTGIRCVVDSSNNIVFALDDSQNYIYNYEYFEVETNIVRILNPYENAVNVEDASNDTRYVVDINDEIASIAYVLDSQCQYIESTTNRYVVDDEHMFLIDEDDEVHSTATDPAGTRYLVELPDEELEQQEDGIPFCIVYPSDKIYATSSNIPVDDIGESAVHDIRKSIGLDDILYICIPQHVKYMSPLAFSKACIPSLMLQSKIKFFNCTSPYFASDQVLFNADKELVDVDQQDYQQFIGMSLQPQKFLQNVHIEHCDIYPRMFEFSDAYYDTYTHIDDTDPWLTNVALIARYAPPIRTIGKYAFHNAPIKSISLEECITNVGERAFYACTNLEYVLWSMNAYHIPEECFSFCTSMKKFDMYKDSIDLTQQQLWDLYVENHPFVVGENAFYGCTSLQNVGPFEASKICKDAFMNCTNLVVMWVDPTYYAGLDVLGEGAFAGCTSLKHIVKSDFEDYIAYMSEQTNAYSFADIVNFPSYVFYGCESFSTTVDLHSAQSIGSYAFAGCQEMCFTNISEQPISIGAHAFKDTLHAASQKTDVKTVGRHIVGVYGDASTYDLWQCNPINIADNAFEYALNLNAVDIPTSVKKIGQDVFCDSPVDIISFTSWNIDNDVPEICNNSFENCKASTAIWMPSYDVLEKFSSSGYWSLYSSMMRHEVVFEFYIDGELHKRKTYTAKDRVGMLDAISYDPGSQYAERWHTSFGTYMHPADYAVNYLTSKIFAEVKPRKDIACIFAETMHEYTGKPIMPSITIDGLLEDIDFTVAYSNDCINVGRKSIVATGIGRYKSSLQKDYIVTPRKIQNSTVSLEYTSIAYGGTNLCPKVTLEESDMP